MVRPGLLQPFSCFFGGHNSRARVGAPDQEPGCGYGKYGDKNTTHLWFHLALNQMQILCARFQQDAGLVQLVPDDWILITVDDWYASKKACKNESFARARCAVAHRCPDHVPVS